MKTIKRIFSYVPPFVLWLMFSVLVWGFVFTRITDAAPRDKLLICVDAQVPFATEMAARLEEALPKEIRMVQVRPFTYAMFDSASLRGADLFIVRASDVSVYRDWFAPLPPEWQADLTADGVPLGLRVWDAAAGEGVAGQYIAYAPPGEPAEDYYLLFGALSLHNPALEGAADDWALQGARQLLAIE